MSAPAPRPTIAGAVAEAARRLRAAGVDSARVDAELLAAHVTRLSRGALVAASLRGAELTDADSGRLAGLVDRRAARVPLQHLTGRAWFRRVELTVGPGVFVPRPETELLAGWAVEQAAAALAARDTAGGAATGPVTVVDLGTGSGAIAAAVADEVPGVRVVAVEIDPQAAEWAGRNLAGTPVELLLTDATSLHLAHPELAGAVDVVVSNPPYIPLSAWESVAPEVRDHDPARALWGGEDGLETVRGIIASAATLLRAGAVLGIEHAEVQGGALPALLAGGAWSGVADHPDLSGRPRYTTARRAVRAPGSGTMQA